LSLSFFNEHYAWRRTGEWRYNSTHYLISALDGGEWSASLPGRFTSTERTPDTQWIWGWGGLRAVLDAVVKRRISSPRQVSNPRTPIVQPVAQRYTDWPITDLDLILEHELEIVVLNLKTRWNSSRLIFICVFSVHVQLHALRGSRHLNYISSSVKFSITLAFVSYECKT
jgi:hypothetical protein